jgi:hypothetical protein
VTPDPRQRIAAYEAPALLGVPEGTVRSWASRGLVYSVGVDEQHRPLYLATDLQALRDRPRRGPRPRPCLTCDNT